MGKDGDASSKHRTTVRLGRKGFVTSLAAPACKAARPQSTGPHEGKLTLSGPPTTTLTCCPREMVQILSMLFSTS